jgi:hypothetical protein
MKISLLLFAAALFAQAQLAYAGGSIARCTSESGKNYFVTNPDGFELALDGSLLEISFLTDKDKWEFADAQIKVESFKLVKVDAEDDQDHFKYYTAKVAMAKKTDNEKLNAALNHQRFHCELEWWHK